MRGEVEMANTLEAQLGSLQALKNIVYIVLKLGESAGSMGNARMWPGTLRFAEAYRRWVISCVGGPSTIGESLTAECFRKLGAFFWRAYLTMRTHTEHIGKHPEHSWEHPEHIRTHSNTSESIRKPFMHIYRTSIALYNSKDASWSLLKFSN